MAALTITPAQVIPSSGAQIRTGVVGALTTITAGQLVYLDTATSTILLSDSDASAGSAVVAGIALGGASTGQVVRYVTEDPALVLGAGTAATDSIVVGTVIYNSPTAGGLTKTFADFTGSNDYISVIGICTIAASATINMKIIAAGAAQA